MDDLEESINIFPCCCCTILELCINFPNRATSSCMFCWIITAASQESLLVIRSILVLFFMPNLFIGCRIFKICTHLSSNRPLICSFIFLLYHVSLFPSEVVIYFIKGSPLKHFLFLCSILLRVQWHFIARNVETAYGSSLVVF